MRKVIKIGFPILCVSVIGVTFYLLNNAQKRVNELKENSNSKVTVEENEVDLIEEDDDDYVEENNITYSVSLEDEKKLEQEVEDQENKAMELVEEIYARTSNAEVYYTSEGMEDDKYIIAVRDEETTEAIIYYIVDIVEESVEIYY